MGDLPTDAAIVPSGINDLLELWRRWIMVAPDERAGSVYDRYPRLFAAAFPGVPDTELDALGRAGRLFATSNFLLDSALDHDPAAVTLAQVDLPVRYTVLLHEAYAQLARLLPRDCALWDRMRAQIGRYLSSLQFQSRFVRGERRLDELNAAEAAALARDKTAMAELAPLALGMLAGDPALGGRLAGSVAALNTALCLLDDVVDWREDVRAGRPNLPVAATLRAAGRTLDAEQARWMTDAQLSDLSWEVLHGPGVVEATEQAAAALDEASSLGAGLGMAEWEGLIAGARLSVTQVRQRLAEVSGHVRPAPLLTVRFPTLTDDDVAGRLARHAVRWLHEEARAGFPSTGHRMAFPSGNGFSSVADVQVGDVFARALVANALTALNHHLGGQLRPLLLQQRSQLMARRRPGEAGLWSYFQDLPELAPDADDLAEILRFLCAVGIPDGFEPDLRRCIELVLASDERAEGAFRTWIVDPAAPVAALQRRLIANAWGSGADVEVVANLVDALDRFDPAAYRAAIGRGRRFVARRQAGDGSWSATWYEGPSWPTRVATRALARSPDGQAALDRACVFLTTAQNADGGWGILPGGPSTALSTALSLLTVAEGLAAVERAARPRCTDALRFLADNREGDDGWPADPLIRMNTGRAQGLAGPVLLWGNRAVTTALVGHAASVWTALQ